MAALVDAIGSESVVELVDECWGNPLSELGRPVRIAPEPVKIGPMISVELERIGTLELLGMTLAHLNDADARGEVSARVPLLMAIRDKLARALQEDS